MGQGGRNCCEIFAKCLGYLREWQKWPAFYEELTFANWPKSDITGA